MLGHRPIDGPEEGLGVGVDVVLADIGTLARRIATVEPAVESRRALALDIPVQGLVDGSGYIADQPEFLEAVPVAFEQSGALPVDSEDLVAVGGLDDAHQRLGMEAVGYYRERSDRALQAVGPEQVVRAQYRQAFGRVVPELRILGECLERGQQGSHIAPGIALQQ